MSRWKRSSNLKPYDIVYVPKTFIAKANKFVNQYIERLILFKGVSLDLPMKFMMQEHQISGHFFISHPGTISRSYGVGRVHRELRDLNDKKELSRCIDKRIA